MKTRPSLGMELDLAFSAIQAALKNRPADVVQDICVEINKLNTQAAKRVQCWGTWAGGEIDKSSLK